MTDLAPLDLPPWLRLASAVTPRFTNWLIPGRLARGELALLEGDPGKGKTLIALDLCARLSTGREWPDGSPGVEPAPSIFVNGEDSVEDTVLARLKALGADLGRVIVTDMRSLPPGERVSLPSRVGMVDDALARTGARLLVLDPVTDFLDANINHNCNKSVRSALNPLTEVARARDCSVVLDLHLNKAGGRRAIYRGAGSIAFNAVCRTVWMVGDDPEAAGRCVLAQVKTNIDARQPSLGYQIRKGQVGPELAWLGPVAWTADDLAGKRTHARPARDRASEFLTAFLADGPRTTAAIWEAGLPQGHTQSTLERAGKDLGVVSRRVWIDSRQTYYWLLPGQELPPVPSDTPELDRMLADIMRQFPPPTPLDDPD